MALNPKVEKFVREEIKSMEEELKKLYAELERANDCNDVQGQLDVAEVIKTRTETLAEMKTGFERLGGKYE